MKYKFSIISPHPDDEFLGCREIFRHYGDHINNVVFVTNGERSVTHLPDLVQYADLRRAESEAWLRNISPHCQLHYLNIPDGMDLIEYAASYPYKIYEALNHESPISTAMRKLQKVVGDDIIVMPQAEKHPSHKLSYNLGEMLDNKKIYYLVHSLFLRNLKYQAGVHYYKASVIGVKYFNYYCILEDSEQTLKRKEFEVYFNSQLKGFELANMKIQNWEAYMSEIPLKLGHEDEIYKVPPKGKPKWESMS